MGSRTFDQNSLLLMEFLKFTYSFDFVYEILGPSSRPKNFTSRAQFWGGAALHVGPLRHRLHAK